MKRPPSDYELLRAIYEGHRSDFVGPRRAAPTRVFQPIDIPAIAATLGTDDDMVFGRLYHHLNQVYSEPSRGDGEARIVFFSALVGKEPNCVNFPLMEAALASLWQERDRQLWAVWASALSIALALAALIVSIGVAVS